jgi:quercetin dioxygenase-like cupin family protein
MEAVKDASHLYEVERRAEHVLKGNLRLFLRDPKEEVRLGPGDTYSVRPRRAHLVTNAGEGSATFLVLQGIGEYDFVPLV